MSAEITHAESIGDLLRGILQDFRTLIREEVALVRVEIGQRATRARAAATDASKPRRRAVRSRA